MDAHAGIQTSRGCSIPKCPSYKILTSSIRACSEILLATVLLPYASPERVKCGTSARLWRRFPLSENKFPFALIAVVILCSPVVPHLILAHQSRNLNSPAWALDAFPVFALLGSLPIALIVAIVATVRRRAPLWSIVTMWLLLTLSAMGLLLIHAGNPYAGTSTNATITNVQRPQ
jgi:hypothetical protein